MTQEKPSKIQKLYFEKSNICLYLSDLIDYEDCNINVNYLSNNVNTYMHLSQEFRKKIRKQTIEYLQQRLKEIDNELEKL